MKLAIIGTAGRAADGKILSSDPVYYYDRMQAAALKVADMVGATKLISGGAAWSDHIAVTLFLAHPDRFSLELHLPTRLVENGDEYRFDDNGTRDFKNNPGAVSNHYHDLFKKALSNRYKDWSPYKDFFRCINSKNFSHKITFGFLNRNIVVAKESDACIAMTFGKDNYLKDGGTAHTMSKFLSKGLDPKLAYHLDLNQMKLFDNAIVGNE